MIHPVAGSGIKVLATLSISDFTQLTYVIAISLNLKYHQQYSSSMFIFFNLASSIINCLFIYYYFEFTPTVILTSFLYSPFCFSKWNEHAHTIISHYINIRVE